MADYWGIMATVFAGLGLLVTIATFAYPHLREFQTRKLLEEQLSRGKLSAACAWPKEY